MKANIKLVIFQLGIMLCLTYQSTKAQLSPKRIPMTSNIIATLGNLDTAINVFGIAGVSFQAAFQPNDIQLNIIKFLIEKKGVRSLILDLPDYQLRYLNNFLVLRSDQQPLEEIDTLIARFKAYDLNTTLTTEEFRALMLFIKNWNDKNLTKIALRGIGTGAPSFQYFYETYMATADKEYAELIRKKINNQSSYQNSFEALNETIFWFDLKSDILKKSISKESFANLSLDIQSLRLLLNLPAVKPEKYLAFRDSCSFNNFNKVYVGKCILLSRNPELAKSLNARFGSNAKSLGSLINADANYKYYAILSDFTKAFRIHNVKTNQTQTYGPVTSSYSASYSADPLSSFESVAPSAIKTGPFIINYLLKDLITDPVRVAYGTNNSFDMLLLFKEIAVSADQ